MLELLPITEHCQPLLVNLALSSPANCLIQMRPKSLSSKTATGKKNCIYKGFIVVLFRTTSNWKHRGMVGRQNIE